MALAVITDIHGNLDALDAVLGDIARRGVSRIVNLGDCLSGPLDGHGTAERLVGLGLPTVRGNHDRALIDTAREEMGRWEAWIADDLSEAHFAWLATLPETIREGDILFCHGSPTDDREEWLDQFGPGTRQTSRDLHGVLERDEGADARLVLCGHTHTQRSLRLPDGRRIVNPGSVGVPAFRDVRRSPPFIHQSGSPDARYALVEEVEGDFAISLVSVPYDASRMAALARERGAEDWARALETGWFS